MHDLLINPHAFTKHLDRATASFSSIALYGQRAKSHDDFWATVSLSRNLFMNDLVIDAGRVRSNGSGMTKSLQYVARINMANRSTQL
jgi:hypothetical protein